MKKELEIIIQKEDDGKTIKEFLRYKLQISHRLLTALKLREKGIMLSGERVFVTALLKQGDVLHLELEEEQGNSQDIVPTKGILNIVYEDEDILVVNKPPNLPVHPSKGHIDDSLANIVMWYYKEKGLSFTYRCINRLDKDTSGLMVIAKNAYSGELLKKQLQDTTLKREYLAVLCGHLAQKEGTIINPIRRIPNKATIQREVHPEGEKAVTHYSVLKENEKYSLLAVTLETGRTHQIRVHFSHLGTPLVGDFLYGKEEKEIISRQALHSHRLTLKQPISGEPLHFECEMPLDMENLMSDKNELIPSNP